MAEDKVSCACAAEFCGHEGQRCGKPVTLSVETQAYQGEGRYGPLRRLGICEECWDKIQEQLPGFFGDDQ